MGGSNWPVSPGQAAYTGRGGTAGAQGVWLGATRCSCLMTVCEQVWQPQSENGMETGSSDLRVTAWVVPLGRPLPSSGAG